MLSPNKLSLVQYSNSKFYVKISAGPSPGVTTSPGPTKTSEIIAQTALDASTEHTVGPTAPGRLCGKIIFTCKNKFFQRVVSLAG